MSCQPSYSYRPTFTPSAASCVAPVYALHRSRVTTAGVGATPLFFRSKQQSFDANEIEVEGEELRLVVYFRNVEVESFPVTPGAGAIAALRLLVNDSDYIEMPPLGVDIYDEREDEQDGDGTGGTGGGEPETGYGEFSRVFLEGGSGAPSDASVLASIRTGPQRTIFIVGSIEDNTGADVTPGPSQQIQQWNGMQWISYCNTVPGQCPGEGTC